MSAAPGRRIGFVDCKLDNFHANVFLKAVRQKLKERGFSVAGCMAMDEAGGKAWAAKNGVDYFDTPEALNEHVDCYMVLAPSNPEVHLHLCRQVVPFGKIIYVDKTFAPDLKTAKEIFTLADQHKVAMQTTSALRYTAVQKKVADVGKAKVQHMLASGGGSSFAEYAIHPLELVISCMGPDVASIKREAAIEFDRIRMNFSDGRTAETGLYHGDKPFRASLTIKEVVQETESIEIDGATLFTNAANGILDFFEAGRETIDRAESLMIRRILDLADDPAARNGFVKL